MGEKRVIEQIASDEIYNDDWFLKDSVLHDTTKVQPSVIKEYVNQGMATSQDLADEATARQNMDSQLASGIGQQMSNLADFYDNTKSYVVGDVCVLQSGELMRCIAPTSGTFDNTKWEQVTVDELFDDLNFSADAISYDNTSSGLEAENVQDAIDETITKLSAVGSASGDIATFADGSDLPMPKLEVAIEPQQEGSGDPSPENVRPIIGWDEVDVTRTGKNLLSLAMFDNNSYFTINGDGSVTQLQNDGRSELAMSKLFLKKGTYTFSRSQAVGLYYIYSMHDGVITWYIQNGSGTSRTFTLDNDDELYIKVSVGGTSGSYPFTANYMIEKGDEATIFEKFNGQTYTIDLDGTRYGGKVDVVSGVMTVYPNRCNLGDLNWVYASTQKVFYCNLPTDALNVTNKNGICEGYKPTSWETMDSSTWSHLSDGEFVFSGNLMTSGRCAVVIKDLNYTDATAFKSAVNDIYMLYPLATPLTIQLSPTVVKSLRGVNNVFADTGAILDAEYIRDLTAIIDYILEQLGN